MCARKFHCVYCGHDLPTFWAKACPYCGESYGGFPLNAPEQYCCSSDTDLLKDKATLNYAPQETENGRRQKELQAAAAPLQDYLRRHGEDPFVYAVVRIDSVTEVKEERCATPKNP